MVSDPDGYGCGKRGSGVDVSDPDGCEWFAATVFDRFALLEQWLCFTVGGDVEVIGRLND